MGRTKERLNVAFDDVVARSIAAQRDLSSEAGIAFLMRRLSDAFAGWRDCPVKRCRRARRCQGPDMVCQLKEPRLNAPPEEIARVNDRMRQIVLRRLERFGVW